jgi:hypothetical protein
VADDETFRKAAQRHLAKAPVAGKRTADVEYRGFVISWLEPPLASDKWTAENAFFLRKMSPWGRSYNGAGSHGNVR